MSEGKAPTNPKGQKPGLPPGSVNYLPGEYVVVRCEKFRCLAYLDPKGKWRAAHGGAELPEVPEVLEVIGTI